MSSVPKPAMLPVTHPSALRKTISGGFEQRMARGPDATRGFKGAGRGARSPPTQPMPAGKIGQTNPGSQVSPQFSFAQATTAKKPSPTHLSVDTSHPPSNPPDISLNHFLSAESPIDSSKLSARQRAAEEARSKQKQLEAAARAQDSLPAHSPLASPAPSPARYSTHHAYPPPSMTSNKGLPDSRLGLRSPGRPAIPSPAAKPAQPTHHIVWVGGNPLTVPSPTVRKTAVSPVSPLGTSPPSPPPLGTSPPSPPPLVEDPPAPTKMPEATNAWEKPRGAKRALGIGAEPALAPAQADLAQGAVPSQSVGAGKQPDLVKAAPPVNAWAQGGASGKNDLDWEVCMSQLGQTSLGREGEEDDVGSEEKDLARQKVMQYLISKQQQQVLGSGGQTEVTEQSKQQQQQQISDDSDVPDSWETPGGWEKETEAFREKEEQEPPKANAWGSVEKSGAWGAGAPGDTPFQGANGLFTPGDLADGRLGIGGPVPDFELACEEEKAPSPGGDEWEKPRADVETEAREVEGGDAKEQTASDALKNMLGIGMMGGGLWGMGGGGEAQPPAKKLPVWGKPGGGLDISMDPAIAQICKLKPADASQASTEAASSPPEHDTLVQKEGNPNPAADVLQQRQSQMQQQQQQDAFARKQQAPDPQVPPQGMSMPMPNKDMLGMPGPMGNGPTAQQPAGQGPGLGNSGGGPDFGRGGLSGNFGLLAPSQLGQPNMGMMEQFMHGMQQQGGMQQGPPGPQREESAFPGLGFNPPHKIGGSEGSNGMQRDGFPPGGFRGPPSFQDQMMPPNAFGGPMPPFPHMPFGMPSQWPGPPQNGMNSMGMPPPPNGMPPPNPEQLRQMLAMGQHSHMPPHMQQFQNMFQQQGNMGPPHPDNMPPPDALMMFQQKLPPTQQPGGPAGGFDFGKMFGGQCGGDGPQAPHMPMPPMPPMPGKILSLAEIEGRQFAE